MDCLEMPRRQRMFRLDDRILDALDEVSSNAGHSSANQFVEKTLFDLMKAAGKIPADAQPLKDGRGGRRAGAGKPKKSTDSVDTDEHS
jgi:hypothetical protein